MKKRQYKNVEGIDFELELQKSEKDYQNLFNDFKVVVGWNTDIAERYAFLTDMLPTNSEVERLLQEYRQRYVTLSQMMELCPASHERTTYTLQGLYDRIMILEKLKHAVINLTNTGVDTAKEFVNVENRHVFDEVKNSLITTKQKTIYTKVKQWFSRKKKLT